jgi:hypothetical protein
LRQRLDVSTNKFSLILISIYFLIVFKHYIAPSNSSSIVYGSALYWQIALVGYSVLATAIQPLKRAATSFSTHTKMPVSNASRGTRSGQSSKLRSLSRARQSVLLAGDAAPPPPPLIWSGAPSVANGQDSDSMESHGSQDQIVKKTDVRVTYSDDRRV